MTALVTSFGLLAALAAIAEPAAAAQQMMPNAITAQPPAPGPVNLQTPFMGTIAQEAPRPGGSSCVDGKPRAGPAPRVVRTMPAPGSVVRPGAMVLSVTFDRPMACTANLNDSRFPLPCPGGKGAVLMAPDRRTLTTVCQVEAGASYSMPLVDFVGDGGVKSERYDLAFTTSTAAPVTDVRQALALEKAGAVRR